MQRKTILIKKLTIALIILVTGVLLYGPISDAVHRYQTAALLNEQLAGRMLILREKSEALRRVNDVYVYLPPGYAKSKQRYPVVYLLHGCPGQASDWFIKGRAHETAEKMILSKQIKPVIVVAADGYGPGGLFNRTEFLNSSDGSMMVEDYISRELPGFIDSKFRTIRSPNARALVGNSSGGYGAVNIGTRHQDVFHTIASHSGFFDPIFEKGYVEEMLGPEGPLWDKNDPEKRVSSWRKDRDLSIYMDCGISDELYQDNTKFYNELKANGIKSVFYPVHGGHKWLIWRDRFHYSLHYCSQRFNEMSSK